MTDLVDPAIAQRLASELLPGEEIVWTGQPSRRKWFYAEDVLAYLFLLPFIAMSAFLFWSAFLHEGILLAGMFSIVMMALALYLLLGRYVSRRRRRRRVTYALTKQRALILSVNRDRKLQTAFFDRISSLQWKSGFRGIGTVSFGGSPSGLNLHAMMGTGGLDPWFGGTATAFADLDDPGAVHALVMSLRQS